MVLARESVSEQRRNTVSEQEQAVPTDPRGKMLHYWGRLRDLMQGINDSPGVLGQGWLSSDVGYFMLLLLTYWHKKGMGEALEQAPPDADGLRLLADIAENAERIHKTLLEREDIKAHLDHVQEAMKRPSGASIIDLLNDKIGDACSELGINAHIHGIDLTGLRKDEDSEPQD